MDRKNTGQGRLHAAWALPDGSEAINDRVWYRDDGEVRAIFHGLIPFYSYRRSDKVNHKFAAVQLVEAGLGQQKDVAAAFGLSVSTLRRARRAVAEEGIGGLVGKPKGPKGRRKADQGVASRIASLRKGGKSHQSIADRLGMSPSTVYRVLRERGLTQRQGDDTPTLPFEDDQSADSDGEADQRGVAACNMSTGSTVEATSIAYASPSNQLATVFGLIEEAPVEFSPASNVPAVGVLLGLALLSTTGLLEEARHVYGRLKNSWYGLRATIWTLFVMSLLRIRRPEQLKGLDPAALGQVLGLPRAPEVKTIRRKLKELARRSKAVVFHRRLARRRVKQREDMLAYLYVDGHVRAYSGKRKIGKAYVTSRKSVMRAETDYWVNLTDGQPLLVVHAPANERLTQMMQEIIDEVKLVVGDRRAMIVFDRGGWSKDLFHMLMAEGFDLLTYRKEPLSNWGDGRFHKRRAKIDGHTVKYELADGTFQKKGWPRLRCIAVKRKDGRQTQILCSRYDVDPVELAYRMFGRWKQENWFKYMGEQFALDVLVDYAIQPDDPDRLVVNPAWRTLNREVKVARIRLRKVEAAFGRVSLSKKSSRVRNQSAAEVERAQEEYERLCKRRRDAPRKIRLGDASDGDPVKLTYERKLLTDTIKMCAYDVETQLTEMLDEVFRRNDLEGRAVVREILQTSGDLTLSPGQLHIHLDQLSAPRYTEAMMSLCDQINTMDMTLPETTFHLRFHVKPRPESGQK
ncbi:MAG: putative transposase [Planctomycetota bacterium]|jgi:transposase